MSQLVVDVDDLCDAHDPFDVLMRLREADPNFKATLFAIPQRCSKALLKKYEAEHDWLRLGMHGWRHTFGECYSWNPKETKDKIAHGIAMGLDDAFRAPKWLITPIIYQVCHEYGIAVADHARHCIPAPHNVKIYRYNAPDNPFKALHYHSWDTSGNGIEQSEKDLTRFIKRGHEYKWVSEAATIISLSEPVSMEQPSPESPLIEAQSVS